jgi:hypothetical protein
MGLVGGEEGGLVMVLATNTPWDGQCEEASGCPLQRRWPPRFPQDTVYETLVDPTIDASEN